jgi:hypothetical protein
MRELLGALTAFLDEHQRCGELDGGLDNGYVASVLVRRPDYAAGQRTTKGGYGQRW